jgi:glycosyltransferase involved in cell wall biosynthesis
VDRPDDPVAVAGALAALLDDPAARERQGRAARRRAESDFSYTGLAALLDRSLAAHE